MLVTYYILVMRKQLRDDQMEDLNSRAGKKNKIHVVENIRKYFDRYVALKSVGWNGSI